MPVIRSGGVTHFDCIQPGVDAVAEGGTVHVLPGIYQENVSIGKSLSLLGAGPANVTLDGQDSGPAVQIDHAAVIAVSDFTITCLQDAGQACVLVNSSDAVTIANNELPAGGGIFLNATYDTHILSNTLDAPAAIWMGDTWNSQIEANRLLGEQIWVTNSSNNRIVQNEILGQPDYASCTGIRLTGSSNNLIADNTLRTHATYIVLRHCDDNILFNNEMEGVRYETDTGGGIVLYHADRNQLVSNHITDVIESGITLFGGSSDNELESNTITGTDRGVEIYYQSNRNSVVNNRSTGNAYGIILDNVSDNLVYRNSFFDNEMQGYDDGENEWFDGGDGNYWGDYLGADDDNDGRGDTPYTIEPRGTDLYPFVNPVPVESPEMPELQLMPYDPTSYYSGVRTVDDRQVWDNRTLVITNPLEIRDGGALVLRNVVVSNVVGSSVSVMAGGSLEVYDSEIHMNGGDLQTLGGVLEVYGSTLYGKGAHVYASPDAKSALVVEGSRLYGLSNWNSDGAVKSYAGTSLIRNNVISDAYVGINVEGATDGKREVFGNRISHAYLGISGGPDTLIENNQVSDVIREGIKGSLAGSSVVGNAFEGIWGPSIYLDASTGERGSLIYENSTVNSGPPWDSNLDDRTQWDHKQRGNYWGDYGTRYPDAQGHTRLPGIWDTPYEIPGPAPVSDDYPLMYSTPAIWPREARNVSATSTTLVASFLTKEHASVETSFEFRRTGESLWQSTPSSAYVASGTHAEAISGLAPASVYEFRPMLTYSRGQIVGETRQFTTSDSIANFVGAPRSGLAPLYVTFTRTGVISPDETILSYLWDFGDDVTSTLPGPSHEYASVGSYTVTLVVTTTTRFATVPRAGYIMAWADQVHLPFVVRNAAGRVAGSGSEGVAVRPGR
jgi:nitrous oxidase accessory protein